MNGIEDIVLALEDKIVDQVNDPEPMVASGKVVARRIEEKVFLVLEDDVKNV